MKVRFTSAILAMFVSLLVALPTARADKEETSQIANAALQMLMQKFEHKKVSSEERDYRRERKHTESNIRYLERTLGSGKLSPEEYAAKRQELLSLRQQLTALKAAKPKPATPVTTPTTPPGER